MDIVKRKDNYSENHCWQYDIRIKNKDQDLIDSGLTQDQASLLRVGDFDLQYEPKEDVFADARDFISRHEWLGKLSLYPTHIFTARYKGILAGVVIVDMPNAFSKMLGGDTKRLERLISRGACISWSPKNLASSLIMYSIKWMVTNTQYRLFTAYSDPEANEIGTIYQACNFYFLGQSFGAKKQYLTENNNWTSDRYFRSRSVYKRIAKSLGIAWVDSWQIRDRVIFSEMPDDIAVSIKAGSKEYMASRPARDVQQKGKYAYVAGENKTETKRLRKLFISRNKVYDYPKRPS